MKVLPFHYTKTNSYYNRLIVEPVKLPEEKNEEGLITPSRSIPDAQLGIVFATCDNSDFKQGDEVQYLKKDRAANENIDTVSIEGKTYDCVYEHKIWAVNDKPYGHVLVRPVSESNVSEEGLVIPSDAGSVTRKGVVYAAPAHFDIKKGDSIEYQNQRAGYYPQANIEGELYDVIFEADIFMVNGKVAPHRIIVKIDRVAQSLKRNTTSAGLKLSPLFIHMLRNLQYAKIADIGKEAKKKYPELKKGDTIIIDHGVESQDYRLIKFDIGKNRNAIFEYRILNCYDFSDMEIFGKLIVQEGTNKIKAIIPLNGCMFLKWNINFFDDGSKNKESLLVESDNDYSGFHNIDDLKRTILSQRKEAAEKSKLKVSGIKKEMAYVNPQQESQRYNALAQELSIIEREEGRISAKLRKDHWVVCEIAYPHQLPQYIISPFEELYPINILGTKFLIGYSDFLLFKSTKNMDIKGKDLIALSDNVLVLPTEDKEEDNLLIIPDQARSKPQYGTVVSIGESKDGIKTGDFVLFRENAGLIQKVDGVEHRVMKQNDLLCVISKN